MREHIALHKHAASTTAGIENLALRRFEHGHNRPHYALWREVFAPALAFGVGELADEVFIDSPQHVHAAGVGAEDVLGKKIDKAGNAFLVKIRAGVNGREQALELWKRLFEQCQNVVQLDFDIIGAGDFDDVVPPASSGTRKTFFFLKLSGSSRISNASCLSVVWRSLLGSAISV